MIIKLVAQLDDLCISIRVSVMSQHPDNRETGYSNVLQVNATSGEGKLNGLTLLLDYQEDLSLHISSGKDEESQNSKRIKNLNFDTVVSLESKAAKVHINTLSPFKGFGGGSYKMTAVKRITAKRDFLKMPLEDRNCKVELYEDCRRRRLLEECDCIPSEATSSQEMTQKL